MTDVSYEQLKLVSEIVKVYGFKGLADYDTEVSSQSIKSDATLDALCSFLSGIKNLFPTHDINVTRLNGIVHNVTTAMNILRSLLTYCGIPWRTRRKNNTVTIKLVDPDLHLLTLTEARLIDHNGHKTLHSETLKMQSWWTNVYKCPDDRVYNCLFKIPEQSGTIVNIIALYPGAKILQCGSVDIYGTTMASVVPESMKWLPKLKYHDYTILIPNLKHPMEELNIELYTMPDNEESTKGQLNCVTHCLNPKCPIRDKPNFFRYMGGMGCLAENCGCVDYNIHPIVDNGFYECYNYTSMLLPEPQTRDPRRRIPIEETVPQTISVYSDDIDLRGKCTIPRLGYILPDPDGWFTGNDMYVNVNTEPRSIKYQYRILDNWEVQPHTFDDLHEVCDNNSSLVHVDSCITKLHPVEGERLYQTCIVCTPERNTITNLELTTELKMDYIKVEIGGHIVNSLHYTSGNVTLLSGSWFINGITVKITACVGADAGTDADMSVTYDLHNDTYNSKFHGHTDPSKRFTYCKNYIYNWNFHAATDASGPTPVVTMKKPAYYLCNGTVCMVEISEN